MKHIASYRSVILWSVVVMCLFFPVSGSAQKVIPVWTYYDFAPFIIEEGKGLAYDFVEMLNTYAKGSYRFELTVYPRKRIDAKLASEEQGIVLFVHWSYMGDKEKTKYLWGPILMHDQNEIVSRADRKIDFDGTAESLKGLTFGGVLGRRYPEFEEAMKRGDIKRDDAHGEEQSLRKLLAGRIDVTTIPKPVLHYFIQSMKLEGKLYVSPTPRSTYTRHLLITKGLQAEHEFLTRFVQESSDTAKWQEMMAKYGY